MTLRGLTATCAVLAGFVGAAPTAAAADRFATTDNAATTKDCLTEATACSLGKALQSVPNAPAMSSGTTNTLTLLPGNYDSADFDAGASFPSFGSIDVRSGLLLQGQPGQPAPTVDVSGFDPNLVQGIEVDFGGTLRHLNIVLNGPGAAVALSGVPAGPSNGDRPGVADRVNVTVNSTSTTVSSVSVSVGAHGTVTNSVVSVTGGLADESAAVAMSPNADAPRLFGVTALSPTGSAVTVSGGATVNGTAKIFNTVARGAVDLMVRSRIGGGGTPEPVVAELTNSAWRNAAPHTVTAGPATIDAKTPPVTGDLKLDGGGKPLEGSPLIDAGTALAELGPLDLDGNARVQGSAPDIGAFEVASSTPGGGGGTPPNETPQPPTSQCGCLPPATPPAPDTKAPTPTSLTPPRTLKRSKLSKGKGVTLTATLDEAVVSAKVELIQITKKKGKKPKEKVLGSATLGASGLALSFALKVKGSKLGSTGKLKLTLRFTFIDAAGNKTVVDKPVTVS